MNQLDMFIDSNPFAKRIGLNVARRNRDAGIRRVSDNNREFLAVMRAVAKEICQKRGWVCADDLRAWAKANNIEPTHYNAFGAILTVKEFTPGEYIVSRQPQGHANRIRKWVLRSA